MRVVHDAERDLTDSGSGTDCDAGAFEERTPIDGLAQHARYGTCKAAGCRRTISARRLASKHCGAPSDLGRAVVVADVLGQLITTRRLATPGCAGRGLRMLLDEEGGPSRCSASCCRKEKATP